MGRRVSAAREAVARAIQLEAPGRCPTHMAQHIADAALAALRPFIAAEIRAWAVRNMTETDQSRTPVPAWQMLMRLDRDASAIADRITTTGEQHE